MAEQAFVLHLFGPPHLERDGRPVDLGRRKSLALLAYLAVTGQPHARDSLTVLLWPDADAARSRASLRSALSTLTKALGGGILTSSHGAIGVCAGSRLGVDVRRFRELLGACASHGHTDAEECPSCLRMLEEAVALRHGEFLAGFNLHGSPDFDEWQLAECDRLRDEAASALKRLVRGHAASGATEKAVRFARRLLAFDPADEEAHRQLMRLHLLAGQPAAALRQYRECARVLEAELGLPPEKETTELYRAVKNARRHGAEAGATPTEATASRSADTSAVDALPDGEIRVVTVMVAGTAPGDDDCEQPDRPDADAGRHAALVELTREVVAGCQGRMAENPGDDAVAIFGVPAAREDDAERAVRTALDLARRAADVGLGVSVGISTGGVYWVSRIAESPAAIPTVGPLMSQAVRLRSHARAGQVLIADATHRQTHRAFGMSPVSVRVAGAARLVQAWRVLDARPRPQKPYGIPGMRSALVGRGVELRALKSAWSNARRGRGQLVCLTGDAGIGKSRLVEEFGRACRMEGPEIQWLEGRCCESSARVPCGPFAQVVQDLAGWGEHDDEDRNVEKLKRFLGAQGDRSALATDRLERTAALLANLLVMSTGDGRSMAFADADPREVQRQTLAAMRDVLSAAARQRPLVLVLEDLHWADHLTLDLVDSLLETLHRAPLLILCVYRRETDHRCRNITAWASRRCPGSWQEVWLRELSEADGRRMVESLLVHERLPSAVKELVVERSQGNPLFLEELLRSLIDAGCVYREGGFWRARARRDELAVPDTIRTMIQSRVDRLESSPRDLLQMAAVIGERVAVPILERLAADHADLAADLASLERAGLLYAERSSPEAEYAFSHVLVQEAVYQAIGAHRRGELHRRVGAAIEKEYRGRRESLGKLAYHFDRSEDAEAAVRYLLEAGESARRAYLNTDAMDYFNRAVKRLERDGVERTHPDWKLRALTGLGRIHDIVSRVHEQEEFFRQAIDEARSLEAGPRELLFFYAGLARALSLQERREEFGRLVQEAWSCVKGRHDAPETVSLAAIIAGQHFLERSEFHHELLLKHAVLIRSLPRDEELAESYHALACAHLLRNRLEDCREFLLGLEQDFRSRNCTAGLASVLGTIGFCLAHSTGDHRGAIAQLQEARTLFAATGDAHHLGQANLWLSYCHEWLRSLQEQQQCAEMAIGAFRTVGEKQGLCQALYMLASSLLCQGRTRAGMTALRESLRISGGIEIPFKHAERLVPAGVLYWHRGRRTQACSMLLEALELLSRPDEEDMRAHFVTALSVLDEDMGDAGAFRELCREFRDRHPEAEESRLRSWQLEPAVPESCVRSVFVDEFRGPLSQAWSARHILGCGSISVVPGLVMQAENGTDFWFRNLTAPRLGVRASGDFAVTTVCRPAFDDRPAIGGLYLFHDARNFLHFERGWLGANQLTFKGYFQDRDRVVGRGYLPSDRMHLRLERRGQAIRALCSPDGQEWWTAGRADFPAADPLEVGLHATARILPNVYIGDHPRGTAIGFESFRLEQ